VFNHGRAPLKKVFWTGSLRQAGTAHPVKILPAIRFIKPDNGGARAKNDMDFIPEAYDTRQYVP
jgi:hypothetical protein